mgnify:CR=1 FL=1
MNLERQQQMLIEAEAKRQAMGPVSDTVPGGLTLEQAHTICEANIATAKAERERRESFESHLRAFRARFQDAEYPPEAEVEGETVYDTYSIYGAGSRIVIGDAWVWWVDNNGMDGDDWSRNNCRLGIARRLPRTDELVEDAHALVTEHAIIKADK